MNTMKRFFVMALALCMMLSLCACAGSGEDETTAGTTAATTVPTTEATAAPTEDGLVAYTVYVVDEGGNPIAGAMVQMCKDTCYPNITDASGAAKFSLAEDEYKVSFLSLPAGYTYTTDAQEFYFEDGAAEITITLKAEA